MEKDEDENFVKTFDEFYTTNHIQIMKSLLPYLGSNAREIMPIIIKYLELQDALQKRKNGCSPWNCIVTPKECNDLDLANIYQCVKKYLSPSEDQTCKQIIQMKSQIENIKQMQQMFELFQDINLSGSSEEGTSEAENTKENIESTGQNDDSTIDIIKLMQFMKDFS